MYFKKIYNNPFVDKKTGETKNRRVVVDNEGKRLTIFPDSWNPAWQEGMEVAINNEWIEVGEYNGSPTYTYQVPPEFRLSEKAPVMQQKAPQAPTGLAEIKAEIAKINTTLSMVLGKLETISHQITRAPEDEKVTQEDIDIIFPPM